jgi:Nif-specific regulatory protein
MARLIAVAGPLEGMSVPLAGGDLTIGRDTANTLCIEADDRLSRRHVIVRTQSRRFVVGDLSQQGRTYVNQRPVSEQFLTHGDEIRAGRSVFVFHDDEPGSGCAADVELDDELVVPEAATTVRKGDAMYLDRETLLQAGSGAARRDRIVEAVLDACRALLAHHRLAALQRHLVESILAATAAERVALVLSGDGANDFASALHWIRSAGPCASFRIPRAVLRHALTDGSALCISDAAYTVWSSQTTMQAQLSSMIAVPLLVSGAVRGAIYADASSPAVRFGQDELRLLTGIAELAALPLATALRVEQLERQNEQLVAERVGGALLIGSSERLQSVRRLVAKLAASDATVLITGASGTGKELVARSIHCGSARAGKPFAAINCAAVSDSLIESEFFGHERGAFTGAHVQKKGRLEEAEGGTVFLDEIGELALPLQAKLLRVLQEREFERVGGTRPIKVDVRVVAATNRDLEEELRRGRFREDLFYRLNVVALHMPPLRDRRDDIPALASHFVRKHARRCSRRIGGLSESAMTCLVAYDWPGNVRELENAIERAIALGTTEEILPDDLPEAIVERCAASASPPKFHERIRDVKRQLVTAALLKAEGNFTEAARQLGLHPNNLHRLVKNLEVGPDAWTRRGQSN